MLQRVGGQEGGEARSEEIVLGCGTLEEYGAYVVGLLRRRAGNEVGGREERGKKTTSVPAIGLHQDQQVAAAAWFRTTAVHVACEA